MKNKTKIEKPLSCYEFIKKYFEEIPAHWISINEVQNGVASSDLSHFQKSDLKRAYKEYLESWK